MYSLQSAAIPTTLALVFKVPDDSNLHASRIHMLLQPKSLYISDAVNNFYEIEFEIWAGFGPVGSTEKKNWGRFTPFKNTKRWLGKIHSKFCS